jgi:hypothetical protein
MSSRLYYLLFYLLPTACCLLPLSYLLRVIEEQKFLFCLPNLGPTVSIYSERKNAAGGHVVKMNNIKVICELSDTVIVGENSNCADIIIQALENIKEFTGGRQVQITPLDDLILIHAKMLRKYSCCFQCAPGRTGHDSVKRKLSFQEPFRHYRCIALASFIQRPVEII